MKNQISYSIPLILTVISNIALPLLSSHSAAYSNPLTDGAQFPRIVGGVSYPSGRVKSGGQSWAYRQSFKLEIPKGSRSISQVTVRVPIGLSVRGNVEVSNDSEQKLDANFENKGREIIIAFTKPVSSGTTLSIDLKDVYIPGVASAWLYSVSARFVGLDAEIPVGVARIGVR